MRLPRLEILSSPRRISTNELATATEEAGREALNSAQFLDKILRLRRARDELDRQLDYITGSATVTLGLRAEANDLAGVKLQLALGADAARPAPVDAASEREGRTPLASACIHGNLAMAMAGHLLVSYGVGLHCVQPEPYWRIR